MIDTATASGARNTGRFAMGNPGGPGNPHGRQVALIRSALLAALTPEVLNEIIARLVEHAVEGNLPAIKLLLGYAVGRPGKAEDLLAQIAIAQSEEADCVAQTAEPDGPHETPQPAPAPVERRQQTDSAAVPSQQMEFAPRSEAPSPNVACGTEAEGGTEGRRPSANGVANARQGDRCDRADQGGAPSGGRRDRAAD